MSVFFFSQQAFVTKIIFIWLIHLLADQSMGNVIQFLYIMINLKVGITYENPVNQMGHI